MKRLVNIAAILGIGGLLVGPSWGVEWIFDAGTEGWQGGISPVERYVEPDTVDALAPLKARGGALEVAGTPVERIFMDSTGFVRRGRAVQQWLCGPEIGRSAADFIRLRVRFRVREGAATFWQIQWLTVDGRAAFLEQRRRQRGLALPDSVQTRAQAFAAGRMERQVWERFLRNWEQGDGRGYGASVDRLRQEEAALLALFQTEERRLERSGTWQEWVVEVRRLEGWKGELLRLGLRVVEQPELLDVSEQAEVGAGEPFVWIDRIVLEE